MRTLLVATVFAMAMPVYTGAHRLDEYLQASRVSLASNRITLEIDLTPGASLASALFALLDRDRDNAVSPAEAESYGRAVLSELVVELDGRTVAMALARVEIPSIDEMRGGLGVIQLRAAGDIEGVAAGRRRLHFRNNHQPVPSVYLVNALIPEEADVSVVSQNRDPLQRGVSVEYNVGPRVQVQWLWLVLGAAALSTFVVRVKKS